MKNIFRLILLLLVISSTAYAQPSTGSSVKVWDGAQTADVTASSALKVDGSAVTQPISAASLPTHAVTQSGTWTVQPGNTANTTAWKVDGSAVTQPVSGTLTCNAGTGTMTVTGTGGTFPVTDSGGSLTVDGTVAATQSGTWSTTVTQATGTNLHAVIDSGTVSTITNVVHVDDNSSTLSVDDGAGSLTVDGTVAATQSGTWTVTGAGGTFPVTDSGGSLTVDGSVTADTELPTATAAADDTANPTLPATLNFLMAYDGSTWDRVKGDSTDGLLVNLGANNDVTVTSGNITADTELTAVAALADATANPTISKLGTFPHVFNGTTWDRARGDAQHGLMVNAYGPGTLDSFGTLITGNLNNQIDVEFFTDTPANLTTVTTSGSGATAQITGGGQFSTGTGAAGNAKGVSTSSISYRSGAMVYALFTATFTTPTDGNGSQRIGPYDTNNGMFIGYEGTTFKATIRRSAVDTGVAKASWNVDTLTGAAGSKFTRAGVPEAIDFTKLNVYRIRFGWLGTAPIYYEVLSPDGDWVTFHVIKQPNNATTPSIATPNIPMTINVLKSGADATNLIMTTGCWGAGITNSENKLTATLTDNTYADLTRSVITGVTTGGGGGYVNVKVTPSGAIVADTSGSTADTELAAAAAAADNTSNPTAPGVLNFNMVYDGSTWDRLRGDSTNGALVNLGANNDVVAAGDVAHDNGDSGNPVKIGTKAVSAFPTAVTANDRANAISDLFGRILTAQIDPAMQKCSSVNVTTSQTGTDVIGDDMTGDNWVLTSGKKIAITSVVISSYATTACRAILWFGDDGDTTFTQNTDKILIPFNTAPTTSSKPGIVFNPPTPVFNTNANRELHLTSDLNCSLDIAVCGYEW